MKQQKNDRHLFSKSKQDIRLKERDYKKNKLTQKLLQLRKELDT